jgi:hypothetical protein
MKNSKVEYRFPKALTACGYFSVLECSGFSLLAVLKPEEPQAELKPN